MTDTIKAIETHYAGHRFRSRLEARWAVFFDHSGIEWRYEIEGYEGNGVSYLPDFYLPKTQTWVEVKGSDEQADWGKLAMAVDYGGILPNIRSGLGTTRGLLLLGPLPRWPEIQRRVDNGFAYLWVPTWTLLQHHKGVLRTDAMFVGYQLFAEGGWAKTSMSDPFPWITGEGSSGPDVPQGTTFKNAEFPVRCCRDWHEGQIRQTFDAYRAASMARFEYGEAG